MADIPTVYQVRLRHVVGDIGPFTLPGQTTMLDLGDLAYSQWPEDGSLLEVKPASPLEVRLISAGKFLDATQTIQGVVASLSPLAPDIITLHLIVRPLQNNSKSGKGSKLGSDGSMSSDNSCCFCVIQ